jgi:hypothetical protein
MKWLNWRWYTYLFAKPSGYQKLTRVMFCCRIKGHPRGIVYYNPYGLEPDGHCKDCGEDIG